MSRIFDAIQMARASRSQGGVDTSETLGVMDLPDRRITPRQGVQLDLTVYGRSDGGEAFYEQARAIAGNANGGVLEVAAAMAEGSDVLLINNNTSEEQICNVVGVQTRSAEVHEVSVSFPIPNLAFWKSSPVVRDR